MSPDDACRFAYWWTRARSSVTTTRQAALSAWQEATAERDAAIARAEAAEADAIGAPTMDQQQIDQMAKALRGQGLTWNQTNFAVSLVRNAVAAERERCKARAVQIVEWHRNDYNRQQLDPIAAELRNGM